LKADLCLLFLFVSIFFFQAMLERYPFGYFSHVRSDILLFVCACGTRDWTQDPELAKQVFYYLSPHHGCDIPYFPYFKLIKLNLLKEVINLWKHVIKSRYTLNILLKGHLVICVTIVANIFTLKYNFIFLYSMTKMFLKRFIEKE
jgi:hypothetical protein